MKGSTKKPRRRQLRFLQRNRLGLLTALGLLVLVLLYAAMLEYSRPHVDGDRLRFDTFVRLVREGRIHNAHILDEDAYVVGRYVPGTTDTSDAGVGLSFGEDHGAASEAAPLIEGEAVPYNAPLVRGTQGQMLDLLLRNAVPITIDQQVGKRVASLASFLLPGLIIVLLFIYLILSYRRGSGLFGMRSGARRIGPEEAGVTFADVAGQDAAVSELREIKEFLADPERFAAIGAAVPKGILLYGPPGCGKTLLAKALAGEAGASFFSISGSDFVELYVGVGASRVRELFKEARENAPALIFIDELDSVGRARGTTSTPMASGEQEQALNQILAEMDGFSTSEGIIVVAATNRPDILDQALLRPGRFDRTVGLERPDENARLAILKIHAGSKRLASEVSLEEIARRAIGLTGADLASVMNEGALLAARAGEATVGQEHLDEALQRILAAPERQRRLSLRDRSIAKRVPPSGRVTFADVAGVDDAIEELAEVSGYLANPDRFAEMGARAPKGILLSGPPGCGKTLLARAVAGEANAAFFSVAGSEFVEVFVGEGASRVRELFAEARAVAPAIVFIDEIDAVGARRGTSLDGTRESDQTLNQILVELDGFDLQTAVVVMGATNRPDILDPALVRPGRFDRHVRMALPDRSGRRRILALHTAGKPIAPDVDLDVVASLTRGFSGADLANVVNEAALLATRRGSPHITLQLLEEGVDRAVIGVASRGTILSEAERRMVAYHEAGHALVAMALPGAALPHKLTIVPRGGTLGHCAVVDTHDRAVRSQSDFLGTLAMLLGGRAAEELVFADRASSAESDLERVGEIARMMVCELGMSDALGPVGYGSNGANAGRSEEEARLIYSEVRRLVDEAYEQALSVLVSSRRVLDRVAEALLERESLSAAELEHLVNDSAVHDGLRVAQELPPDALPA